MKNHPLKILIAKKEIAKLEQLASQAKTKDQYMALRIQAQRKRIFFGL